jgi:hypothetical protein
MLYHLIVMARWQGRKTPLPGWLVLPRKGKIALPEQGLAMGAACAGYQPDNASNITEDKDNIVMFQDPYFTYCGLSYHLWPVCSGVSGPVPWRHNGVPFLL